MKNSKHPLLPAPFVPVFHSAEKIRQFAAAPQQIHEAEFEVVPQENVNEKQGNAGGRVPLSRLEKMMVAGGLVLGFGIGWMAHSIFF